MALNSNGLLDMSLDQIIEAKPNRGRRNGGGGGGAMRNQRRSNQDNRSRPYASSGSSRSGGAPSSAISGQLVVSNLGQNVTESDVRELFSQIGPVRSAQLNYNANGKSKGVATVIFRTAKHAQDAIREYHNRALDGKPMKIDLVVKADAAPALTSAAAPRRQGQGLGVRNGRSNVPARGGVRKGRQGGREKRTPKTQEDLDAEMEAYMKDETTMELDAPSAQPATNGVNLNLANALA
ncbi:hypothetical protein DFJ77DRAFT_456801 [Powellomyces hirtus]|nr:hypothetical protein DFJ77DRAFT_456801 [Powellomyces hirtus]